jgi:ABC-type dipeptide/oligopeptide/nickel transport system permease subunit
MITIAIVAFNFVGDGLRDALDPRLRGIRKAS